MKIVLLTGGQGGLKLFEGLRELVDPDSISMIVNTADNIWLLGLYIAPDVDSATYLTSGILDTSRYWGITGDTFNAFSVIEQLTTESWFALGDRDLAIHIVRTYMIKQGFRLTEVTRHICRALGSRGVVIPMSDTHVETHLHTDLGDLHVQEYLVRYAAKQDPEKIKVSSIEYRGISDARATPEALDAINSADLIILGPSNPLLSISPILHTQGVRACIKRRREEGVPVVAVTPISRGRAFTGVAHVLLKHLGFEPTVYGVAELYSDIISSIVADSSEEEHLVNKIRGRLGVEVILAGIAMNTVWDKTALAQKLLSTVMSRRIMGGSS
ncbi:MAG: 2-phospho-L-lactate transferase [Ignisphaera sp.]|nr:2-phospho-L-lactate transferase [Ignisphaera sp.]MCX8168266.1 2-phospho-L-lactate transferase [Ignisphaera sp.]MDW8084866.1 2-phospho-L-lactate transferase [Ignisphaera sp.]